MLRLVHPACLRLSQISIIEINPNPDSNCLATPKLNSNTISATYAEPKHENVAQYDFLENRNVARRFAVLLRGHTSSVGLVGPFGAGKSSIIEWTLEDLATSDIDAPRFIVCKFSCWGFETSSSVINEMLKDAIKKVGAEIDVFNIESLPDSYRQTFAAGGDWVERVSQMLLGKQSPDEQFERLSQSLLRLNSKLLFIVEDLDRNETRSFETEEVLAFLERLKRFRNLSFILTGGLNASIKIDFAKLCDHIESLRTIDARIACELISRVHDRCENNVAFPHIPIRSEDERTYWREHGGVLMADLEEMTLQQAVASLLKTPRALRHSLQRTHAAWRNLCGEVNLDQLIVLNVIRYGAPEAFNWLLGSWERLHSRPGTNFVGIDRTPQFKKSIQNQWQALIRNVDWNPSAALKAIEFILPASVEWLSGGNFFENQISQPLKIEKYWLRAVNEAFESNAITDQQVAKDEMDWRASKSSDSLFVSRLSKENEYAVDWKYLAGKRLGIEISDCPLLLTQVFDRICQEHGPRARLDIGGLHTVWKKVNAYTASPTIRQHCLEEHFVKASNVSLRMTSDLWYYFCCHQHGQPEIMRGIRVKFIDAVMQSVTSGERLNSLLDPLYPYTLYHLVFESGEDKRVISEVLQDWGWLAKPIREGIKSGHQSTIRAAMWLCSSRDDGNRNTIDRVDREVFVGLFEDDCDEVIADLLAMTANNGEGKAEFVYFAKAARRTLAEFQTDAPSSADVEPNKPLNTSTEGQDD